MLVSLVSIDIIIFRVRLKEYFCLNLPSCANFTLLKFIKKSIFNRWVKDNSTGKNSFLICRTNWSTLAERATRSPSWKSCILKRQLAWGIIERSNKLTQCINFNSLKVPFHILFGTFKLSWKKIYFPCFVLCIDNELWLILALSLFLVVVFWIKAATFTFWILLLQWALHVCHVILYFLKVFVSCVHIS